MEVRRIMDLDSDSSADYPSKEGRSADTGLAHQDYSDRLSKSMYNMHKVA